MQSSHLIEVFEQTLKATNPGKLVREYLEGAKDIQEPVYLIAVGKAAVSMAEAVQEVLGDRLNAGVVVAPASEIGEVDGEGVLEYLAATHPVPDERSVRAAERLVSFAEEIPAGSEVLCCISGGTSSLLCKPAEGLSFEDLATVHELLLRSGADIREVNRVRKHISGIKGGGLLRHFGSSVRLQNLIISDVPFEDPSLVGSGPTMPDASTFAQARAVLMKYGLVEQLPQPVSRHLEKGVAGAVPETLKAGEESLKEIRTEVIGSGRRFAEQAAALFREKGYDTEVAEQAYTASAGEVAAHIYEKISAYAKSHPHSPKAFVFYGESTVEVSGKGRGGRNQHLALHAAMKIDGLESVTWLSAGTDGIDGPTDAAGAVVDGGTIRKAEEKGLIPEAFLADHDSYTFHEETGTLLKTGPTGNNVMDIQLVVVN